MPFVVSLYHRIKRQVNGKNYCISHKTEKQSYSTKSVAVLLLWTNVINPQFALSLPQFRYSAVDIQNPPCIITYLRTYLKYPQVEYLVKAGLGKYVGSKMILKKIGSDKGFRKWLMVHREELRAHHYYVDVVLRGYRTGKPLEALQSYREAKINLRNNNTLAPIRKLFKDTEREKFFDYISKQNTNANTYLDYLKA